MARHGMNNFKHIQAVKVFTAHGFHMEKDIEMYNIQNTKHFFQFLDPQEL